METIHIVQHLERPFQAGSDRSRAWRILQAFDGLPVSAFVAACDLMEKANGTGGDPGGWVKFFTATGRYENKLGNPNARTAMAEVRPCIDSASDEKKVCPECGHQFQGNGWDGIDAHWKSPRKGHEHIMPYSEAWPIIRSGGRPSDC